MKDCFSHTTQSPGEGGQGSNPFHMLLYHVCWPELQEGLWPAYLYLCDKHRFGYWPLEHLMKLLIPRHGLIRLSSTEPTSVFFQKLSIDWPCPTLTRASWAATLSVLFCWRPQADISIDLSTLLSLEWVSRVSWFFMTQDAPVFPQWPLGGSRPLPTSCPSAPFRAVLGLLLCAFSVLARLSALMPALFT